MPGTGKNREDRKTEMGSGKKAKQKIQKRQKGKGGEENGKNRDLYGDGCEEIEALTVVDVIRRAQMEIVMLSVGGSRKVTGSHGIAF